MPLSKTEIASIPPVDTSGEMKIAATLLTRFRKQLTEGDLTSLAWRRWVAESLLSGLPQEEQSG